MFAGGMTNGGATQLIGMTIALGVPIAASINVIMLKKAGTTIDLIPAVLVGALISALSMLSLIFPLHPSWQDLGVLAALGFFQLGFPCMLMVTAARTLSAPEISLLGLIEVLLGPLWAWLWAGEVPSSATLSGGALVVAALAFNEMMTLRRATPSEVAQANAAERSGTAA